MTPEYFNFIGYDISIGYLVIWFGAPIHIMPCVTPGSHGSVNGRRSYTSYPLHAILFPPQLTMSHRSICTDFYLFSTAVIVTLSP